MTNEKMHAPADTCNPIVERHADGTALVRVDGAELAFTGTSDTPRVRDLDLAGWFGYERPRKIRELIKRMEREGKLRGIDWRPTVGRQSTGNGASREYKVTVAWLTREQSLLVATQAEGDRAWALTEAMARVFEAVLDRRPPPPAPADPTMALAVAQALALVPGLVERVQSLSAEVSTLRAEVSTGVVGEAVAQTEIIRPLGQIAALAATTTKGPRSVRRRYENRLRALLGHAGPGSRWSMLPRRHLDVAQRQVAMWLDEAIDQRAERNRVRQGQLFLGPN
ncbi:hypothetical protein [Luteitalea sp.]|uniref:hypothetical protein n=1 Tax=Luteitalea sp. TaxID=2004800 RepID=UPI0025C024B6|nr:hypothetical protein [Luteitalea sp.]